MKLRNVTLELSAKAFKDDSEATMAAVCRTLFRQWQRLISVADRVSVLLWIADGTEILDYAGSPDDTFEWAYWQGVANAGFFVDNLEGERAKNIHLNPVKYRRDAAPRTYAWLKKLTGVIRETGREYGKPVQIGATFDNGPEFSVSDFKYRRHREIARANSLFPHSFVTCDAVLHADARCYAAFPGGIPEGTSLGTFLGAQYRRFAEDLGFDYIWLSNGMGFGLETWGLTGALFDGDEFHPERKEHAEKELLKFWSDFRAAAPDARIETRGSNFTAGVEMSTDAAPLPWLYRNDVITAPVNSPSSAIYFNTGLSIAAWMSHIAELPGNGDIPFRYYIHDPWFLNSPWLDRYGREPWDLYPVMAAARITADGTAQAANRVAFLSCDDSFGNMPDAVPDEVIPRVLEAFRTRPDAPGILSWVYPFEEYSLSDTPERTLNEECFLVDAMQSGLPLNTVISTGNFRKLVSGDPAWFRHTVAIVPAEVLREEDNFSALRRLVESGNDAIVYGALSGIPAERVNWLGLATGDPLSGTVTVDGGDIDAALHGKFENRIRVLPVFHNGPLRELPAGAKILATAAHCGESRVLAALSSAGKGRVGFVRSLSPYLEERPAEHNRTLRQSRRMKGNGDEVYPAERLMRRVLAELGWIFRARVYYPGQAVPRLAISRNDGAFLFSGFAPDTTVEMEISTPLGIPLPMEREIRIEGGKGVFHLEKAVRFSCRAFVKQDGDGILSTKMLPGHRPELRGRLDIIGLRKAEIRFFPPPGCGNVVVLQREAGGIYGPVPSASGSTNRLKTETEVTAFGTCHIVKEADGIVNISWGNEQ